MSAANPRFSLVAGGTDEGKGGEVRNGASEREESVRGGGMLLIDGKETVQEGRTGTSTLWSRSTETTNSLRAFGRRAVE